MGSAPVGRRRCIGAGIHVIMSIHGYETEAVAKLKHTNYDEVELAFEQRPCLSRMLAASEYQSFHLQECVMNRSAHPPLAAVQPTNKTLTPEECSPNQTKQL